MDLKAVREDASWYLGKQPRMAIRPGIVLALVELAETSERYIAKPGEKSLAAVVKALKRVREV